MSSVEKISFLVTSDSIITGNRLIDAVQKYYERAEMSAKNPE
jgi:hypothetical protein